ncbi:hypothetical protein F4777DRAFT_548904 [Nemania sp. FL0916]|nr:hypothetical protein F4777DRAFT_548904 [Nemania sp. FL0916]
MPPKQEPIEAAFQSLSLGSVPPLPPRAHRAPPVPPRPPLRPTSTQNQPVQPGVPPPGSFPTYRPYVPQNQTPPLQEDPRSHAPPASHAQQNPYPASPPREALPKPTAVTRCIESASTFATDWYYHPEAPEYLICSRCYVDHIYGTKYQEAFHCSRFDDGEPRLCRFSKPRMKDHIFKEALASDSLRSAVEWMRWRSTIPDCKGVEGVKGELANGIVWYGAHGIPGFLSCQACYEDLVLTSLLAHYFSVSADIQGSNDTRACDIALTFITREYEERAKRNDWQGFAAAARARLTMQPCPMVQRVQASERKWLVPRAGPQWLILCFTCYCDYVIHTGEESKWDFAQGLTRDHKVRCARGSFNIQMLMAQAQDTKNFAMFWDAVRRLDYEKPCEDDGIVDGVWYTLPSKPRDFGVCGSCHVAVLEPLGVACFWERKTDVSPGAKVRCCFNIRHPRIVKFLPRLLEMYATLDPTALDEYASVCASIPPCPRDEEKPNRRWYGWGNCIICPECYQDFARHSPLEELMMSRDTLVAGNMMCEMYSPRMRKLYTESGNANPPNLEALLQHSAQRRQVYKETMPRSRMIKVEEDRALERQKMLNTMSSHYSFMGQLNANTGMPGMGYGFMLEGAAYGQQAMGIAASVTSGGQTTAIEELEQRWRAVE